MVCIQCYLPPILFMIYMKFIQPIIAPYIQPAIEKVVTYFWGPQALQSDACPIKKPKAKTVASDGGDGPSTSGSSKSKDD